MNIRDNVSAVTSFRRSKTYVRGILLVGLFFHYFDIVTDILVSVRAPLPFHHIPLSLSTPRAPASRLCTAIA